MESETTLELYDRIAALEVEVAALCEQLAALTAERDELRRRLEEYAELHADLQRQVERQLAAALTAERDDLRAQLDQAQNQLDWYAQFGGIPTPPWKQATPAAALTQEEE